MPRYQNESKCKTIHMKMSSAFGFIFMQIKVIFIGLALKQRHKGTRKWPILNSLQKAAIIMPVQVISPLGTACLPLAVCTIYELLKRSNFKRFKDLLGHNEQCSLFLKEYIGSRSHFYPYVFSLRDECAVFIAYYSSGSC